MNSGQKRALILVILFVVAAWLLSPIIFSMKEPVISISKAPPLFNASEADQIIRDFAVQFPNRVFGSLESRQAAAYLGEQLENLGYQVDSTLIDARIHRRKEVGRNVIAYKQGLSNEVIALVAHLDIARTTQQGAMDNASGVGILLELARLFAARPTTRSLLIVFTDGKEWGAFGAADIAENHPARNRIAAALSLDNAGIGDIAAFCIQEDGQHQGYAPPWLRRLVSRTVESHGMSLRSASGLSEHIQRSLYISTGDQGPFLSVGIPAINFSAVSADRAKERAVYHSPEDVVQNLKASSIGKFGVIAEQIVRTLDEMTPMPQESQGYFRIWEDRFICPAAIRFLHCISFLPFLAALFFYLKNHRNQLNWNQARREILAVIGVIVPVGMIFFAISMFRTIRMIPWYTLYPAFKDPTLQNPPLGILGGIFGTALFFGFISFFVTRYWLQNFQKPLYDASKQVLLMLLFICVAWALWRNSYWTVTFLLIPAWIWALTGPGKDARSRAINRILIVAAGIPYFALTCHFALRTAMGWKFAWYEVLALGNGLFELQSFIIGAFVAALGIRFLAIQSHAIEQAN